MLCIELSFPARRYHATAWGRHVNEGVPEWPPSPVRIARALVDMWHRRRPDWTEDRVVAALRLLAGTPRYELPTSTVGHIRAYMAQKTDAPDDKKMIFDAFVALDPGATVRIHFAQTNGTILPSAVSDLGDLLAELDYLGRSQSWVDARLVTGHPERGVCPPALGGEEVTERVACLLSPDDYGQLPAKPILGKGKKRHAASWLAALSLSSKEIQSLGWNGPPTVTWVDIPLPRAQPSRRKTVGKGPGELTRASYRLNSKVLPHVTETVGFAERCRRYLMGYHRKAHGGDPSCVSQTFSGKNADGSPASGHQHAYFLPIDQDGDGRIDHVIISASRTFDTAELTTLDRFRRIHGSKGLPEIHLALTSLSGPQHTIEEWVSKRWYSATPFVPPRHHRRGRGTPDEWVQRELARECSNHGLPEPRVEHRLDETAHTPPKHWFEFQRSRKGERQRSGYGFVISFSEPITGPFAIGYGAHFGLGLFLPAR